MILDIPDELIRAAIYNNGDESYMLHLAAKVLELAEEAQC